MFAAGSSALIFNEGSYSYCRELTQEVYEQAEADGTFTRKEQAAFALAEQLKELFEDDGRISKLDACWMADAVSTYLSEVNWHEIAEHYIADADFDEETEEEA